MEVPELSTTESMADDGPWVMDRNQSFWRRFCPPTGTVVIDWMRDLTRHGHWAVVEVGPYVLPAVLPALPAATGELRASAYQLGGGDQGPPIRPRRNPRRRQDRPGQCIEVAIASDLWGLGSLQIAESMRTRDLSEQHGRGRSRTVDRWKRAGRQSLHDLGAWPWSLADGGVLPTDWRDQEFFVAGLAWWHRLTWASAYRSLVGPVECGQVETAYSSRMTG